MTTNAMTSVFVSARGLVDDVIRHNPTITAAQALDLYASTCEKLIAIQGSFAAEPVGEAAAETVRPRPEHPAVAIEDSVQPDYIVCLEDGTQHIMMKRYLKRVYNLTPEQYLARWGLPVDYPLVAPNYSERKRGEALTVGLGTTANKQGLNVSTLRDGELAVA
jgi:predicted transcriptional regulator